VSPEAFDKPALIQLRLENARKTLKDAHTLFEQGGTPASIVNRGYYAMFYATLAMLVTVDRHSAKHSGVIALFDKEFVKENIIPKELSRMLHQAFESRIEGDYQDNTTVDRHLAAEILESADKFVRAIEDQLSKSS
jgi:uncharacterized protein (UPF0332 family)